MRWYLSALLLAPLPAAASPDWTAMGVGAAATALTVPAAIGLGNATAGRSSNLAGGLLPPVAMVTLLPPAATVGAMSWSAHRRGGHLRKPGLAYGAGVGVSLATFGVAASLRMDTHRAGPVVAYTLGSVAVLPVLPVLLVEQGATQATVTPTVLPGEHLTPGWCLHARF